MSKYMRDWKKEIEQRCSFIRTTVVDNAKANGVIIGLSGGKDSILSSILALKAGVEVFGVIMPCGNRKSDEDDAKRYAEMFGIEYTLIDLRQAFDEMLHSITSQSDISPSDLAAINIKPRLRMITLYSLAQTKNYLVLGTDNRSETLMGYFTKWGDGAADLMAISDLTVTEIYDCLKYIQETEGYDLQRIINKAPSAGLFEGQTDESEMGVTYKEIDEYILNGTTNEKALEIINTTFNKTKHKRCMPPVFVSK